MHISRWFCTNTSIHEYRILLECTISSHSAHKFPFEILEISPMSFFAFATSILDNLYFFWWNAKNFYLLILTSTWKINFKSIGVVLSKRYVNLIFFVDTLIMDPFFHDKLLHGFFILQGRKKRGDSNSSLWQKKYVEIVILRLATSKFSSRGNSICSSQHLKDFNFILNTRFMKIWKPKTSLNIWILRKINVQI